jgi:hypothetical protein
LGAALNMRVYHFINEEFGLKVLREKRLKISRIKELNDPFELFSVEMTNPAFRRSMNSVKDEVAKNFGVNCFSKNWKNPVQWAHYADKHKGICLGFDIDSKELKKVNYVSKRLKPAGTPSEELIFKIFRTKYIHWSYEEEYRVFIELTDEEDGMYFINFKGNMVLKEVIVGVNSLISRKDLNSALGEDQRNVNVFKARPGFKNFEMVENKNPNMWT